MKRFVAAALLAIALAATGCSVKGGTAPTSRAPETGTPGAAPIVTAVGDGLGGAPPGTGDGGGGTPLGTGAVTVAGDMMPAIVGDRVMLTLTPAAKSPPADMPAGEVSVTLPLYPGGAVTDLPFKMPFTLTPGSPYLKRAFAHYKVPAPPAVVEAWYRTALVAAGYQESGSGSNMDHDAVVSTGIQFDAPGDSRLRVLLSFQVGPNASTLVQYYVTTVAVPVRPFASFLPDSIQQVEVTYRPWAQMAPPPTLRRTLTDPAQIAGLVAAINALSRDARGFHSCLESSGQVAELTFADVSGAQVSVAVDPACGSVRVGDVALVDSGAQNVWNWLSAIMDGK